MAPMFPFVPTAQQGMAFGSNEISAWPRTQTNSQMASVPRPESTVLSEKSENRLPSAMFTPVNIRKENISDKQLASKAEDITFVSENNDVHMTDPGDAETETDSDAENGGIIAPSQKRKRRTNNSLNHYLDAGVADLDIPPPKRLYRKYFGERIGSPNLSYQDDGLFDAEDEVTSTAAKPIPLERERGVLVGVWKDSPSQDPAKRHAVWGFLDAAGHIRRKIMPETRDGEKIEEGYPIGTGKGFVSPDGILPEPHLLPLTGPEIKEYVRIRSESRSQNELPEERKKAEALAVLEAKNTAANNLPAITVPAPPRRLSSTPTAAVRSETPLKRPKGFLVGTWRYSDAIEDADKHAIYAVIDGDIDGPIYTVRLRVKVSQQTRDRRIYRGNFPPVPGASWVPFEHVVLEAPLAKLTRLEVTEYVRTRHVETINGKSELGNWIVDVDTIERAKANMVANAEALGFDPILRNADLEAKRKAQYKHKKSKGNSAPMRASPIQSTKAPTAPMHTPCTGGRRNSGAVSRETTVFGDTGTKVVKTEILSDDTNQTSRAATAEISTPTARENKADKPFEKPMAKRSNKADARARHEKVMKKMNPDNKSKDPALEDEQLKVQAAEKSVTPSRRTHNLNETVGVPSGNSINRERRSIEGVARIHNDAEKKKQNVMRHEVLKERAEIREIAVGDGKTVEKNRLEKEAKERAKEKHDAEVRADAGWMFDDKKQKAEEKRKAIEMTNPNEGKAEEQKRQAEQKVWAEGQRKKFDEQRKAGEQKRSEERLKADERQKAEERQKQLAKARVGSEAKEKERQSEQERQEKLRANKAEGEISVASPARVDLTQEDGAQPAAVMGQNDIRYERRIGGPLDGKLVGEKRELMTIKGVDYVEFRVLIRMDY